MAKTYRIVVDRGIGGKPVAKESDIQRAILDWLAAERIWHIRLNTGAMAGSHKGKKWFVRFGRPGMADILAIHRVCEDGHFNCNKLDAKKFVTWIEVKGPKGTQSDDQKRFQKEVTEQGMTYILARSLDDVLAALK